MNKVVTIDFRIVVIVNMLSIGLMYLLPTLSHMVAVPLYKFEPMRCVLLMNLLVLGNKKNAYLLAATLPLFSFAVSGHPVFFKMLIMTVELIVNIFLFYLVSGKVKSTFVAMFISICISKVVYYLLKYFIIMIGLMATTTVETSLATQLLVSLAISLLFVIYTEKRITK